jgi:type VI protein secretion system component VasK
LTSVAANPKIAFRALTALAAAIQPQVAAPVTRSAAKRLGQIVPNLGEDDAQAIANAMEHSRALPTYRKIYYQRVLFEKLAGPLQEGTKPPPEIAREAAQALDDVLNKSLEELQQEQPG